MALFDGGRRHSFLEQRQFCKTELRYWLSIVERRKIHVHFTIIFDHVERVRINVDTRGANVDTRAINVETSEANVDTRGANVDTR